MWRLQVNEAPARGGARRQGSNIAVTAAIVQALDLAFTAYYYGPLASFHCRISAVLSTLAQTTVHTQQIIFFLLDYSRRGIPLSRRNLEWAAKIVTPPPHPPPSTSTSTTTIAGETDRPRLPLPLYSAPSASIRVFCPPGASIFSSNPLSHSEPICQFKHDSPTSPFVVSLFSSPPKFTSSTYHHLSSSIAPSPL